MNRGPQRLRQQVRISPTDTAAVDAPLDSCSQRVVSGPRPLGSVRLTPAQQKCNPIVIGIFQTECYVRMHATLQNGNRIFIRLRNDRG